MIENHCQKPAEAFPLPWAQASSGPLLSARAAWSVPSIRTWASGPGEGDVLQFVAVVIISIGGRLEARIIKLRQTLTLRFWIMPHCPPYSNGSSCAYVVAISRHTSVNVLRS